MSAASWNTVANIIYNNQSHNLYFFHDFKMIFFVFYVLKSKALQYFCSWVKCFSVGVWDLLENTVIGHPNMSWGMLHANVP